MPEETANSILDAPVAEASKPAKPRKEPQDHLKPAAQIEAEAEETLTVTWEGKEFVVPASGDDWDLQTSMAIEKGQVIVWLSLVLGPARFGRLNSEWRKEHGRNMKNKDAAPLVEAILSAMGFEGLGE